MARARARAMARARDMASARPMARAGARARGMNRAIARARAGAMAGARVSGVCFLATHASERTQFVHRKYSQIGGSLSKSSFFAIWLRCFYQGRWAVGGDGG